MAIFVASCGSKEEKVSQTKEVEYLPEGAVMAYENYKSPSGKIYKVPILSDGKGGQVRWMADVLWADLPIETRIGFALKGGGLLNPRDLQELWEICGQWKKTGETLTIIVKQKGE